MPADSLSAFERRRLEATARATLASAEHALAEHHDLPPARGDLYTLDAGADSGIEWLVAAEPEGDRATLVPVDGMPLVGLHDLALAESPAAGPRIVRGVVLTAAPITLLDAGRRTGRVSTTDLDRFWSRVTADDSATDTDATRAETSADPDYQAWIDDHVRPAIAALDHEPASDREPARATAAVSSWWALAASVVLAAGLGWMLASATTPVSTTPADGEVALAFFAPPVDTLRSADLMLVERTPDAERVVLAFRTLAPEPYAGYRLDLHDLDTPDGAPPFWTRDDLHLQGTSEVVVGVAVERLDALRVEARLFGVTVDGTVEPLERWRFRLAD